jgi:hypothetical protein
MLRLNSTCKASNKAYRRFRPSTFYWFKEKLIAEVTGAKRPPVWCRINEATPATGDGRLAWPTWHG